MKNLEWNSSEFWKEKHYVKWKGEGLGDFLKMSKCSVVASYAWEKVMSIYSEHFYKSSLPIPLQAGEDGE